MVERSAVRKDGQPARQMNLIFDRGSAISERFEKSVGQAYAEVLREAIPYGYDVLRARAWEATELPFECRREEGLALQDYLQAAFGARASTKTATSLAGIVAMLVLDKVQYADVVGIHFRCLLKLSTFAPQLSPSTRVSLLAKARNSTVAAFDALVESAARGITVEPQKTRKLRGTESSINAINRFDQETSRNGDERPLAEKLEEVVEDRGTVTNRKQIRIFDTGMEDPNRLELYTLWVNHQKRKEPSMSDMTFFEMLDQYLVGMLQVDQARGELGLDEEKTLSRLRKELHLN